jgi:hypothetical protein
VEQLRVVILVNIQSDILKLFFFRFSSHFIVECLSSGTPFTPIRSLDKSNKVTFCNFFLFLLLLLVRHIFGVVKHECTVGSSSKKNESKWHTYHRNGFFSPNGEDKQRQREGQTERLSCLTLHDHSQCWLQFHTNQGYSLHNRIAAADRDVQTYYYNLDVKCEILTTTLLNIKH